MPEKSNKEILAYSIAVIDGISDGFRELVEVVKHPIDKLIVPVLGVVVDAAIIINLYPDHENHIVDTEVYRAAVDRMRLRVENAVATIEVIKNASGPEQVRVAAAMTTMALVPAGLIKSAQAISNTLRFGVPNPTLFKPATQRLLDPTPPLEPAAQHCLTHLDIIEHGFQIRGDRDCIFVISKQGKLVIVEEGLPPYYGHRDIGQLKDVAAAGEVKITCGEIVELNNLSGTYGGYFDKRLLEYVFGRYGYSEVYESGVIRQLRVENVPVHLRSHLGLLDSGPISYSAISMAPDPLSVLHGILSAGKAAKKLPQSTEKKSNNSLGSTPTQQPTQYIGIFFGKGSTEIQIKLWFRGGSTRAPGDIFSEGFTARGMNTDLVSHIDPTSKNSAYISTSTSKSVAFTFPKGSQKGFVYEIRPQQNAIHIAEAVLHDLEFGRISFEDYTMVKSEKEMAVPSKISNKDIRGVWEWEKITPEKGPSYVEVKSFTPNPYYVEVDPFPRTRAIIKRVGQGVTAVGIVLDGASLYQAFQQSQQSKNYAGFFNETARVVGGWSSAIALGSVCARTGALLFAANPATSLIASVVGGVAGSIIGYTKGGDASRDFVSSLTQQQERAQALAKQVPISQLPAPEPFARSMAARNDALSSLTRYAIQQAAFNPQMPSLFQTTIESSYDRQRKRENAIRDAVSFLGLYTDVFSVQQAFNRASSELGRGESLSISEFLSTLHLTGLAASYNSAHPFQPICLLGGDGVTGGVENEVSVIRDLPNSLTHATAGVYYVCLPHHVQRLKIADIYRPWILGGFSPPPNSVPTNGYTFEPKVIHRLMAETWSGYDKHGTYPFFSLHFNKEGYLYPIIHPAYQNTLTGETISLLDNWLKSYLNGFIYAANYLKRWHQEMNLDDKVLAENTTRLADYFKQYGKCYRSLRELMSRSGIDNEESAGITGHYNQPFQVAFRIIATNQVQRHNSILLFKPDFRIEYDITPMPDRKAALESYRATNGCYPEYYEKTKMLYQAFAEKIKEDLPLLPESESYFAILGLVNSLCYTFTTLKTMGLAPVIPAIPEEHYAVPKAFPPIPVEYFKTVEVNLSLGELLRWLTENPEECKRVNNIFMLWFKDDNTKEVRPHHTGAYAILLQKRVDGYRRELQDIFKKAAKEIISIQFSKHGIASQEAVNQDDVEHFAENALECLTQIHTKLASELYEKTRELLKISNAFFINWTLADITTQLQDRFSTRVRTLSDQWQSLSPEKIVEALLKEIDASEHQVIKDLLKQVPQNHHKEAAIHVLTAYFAQYQSKLEQMKAWVHTYVNELSKNTFLSDNILLKNYTHVSKQHDAALHKTKVSGGTCLEMPSIESMPIEMGELLESKIGGCLDIQTVSARSHYENLCVIPIQVQSLDEPKVLDVEPPVQAERYGNTAIHYAAQSGAQTEIAQHIHECEQQNNRGATALVVAAQNKQTDTVVQLIQAGANSNHKLPNGLFPLYIAIQYHDEATALALLEDPRLDIEGKLDTQMTPLLAAMEEKLWAVALRLIERGAVLTKPRQSDGYTAIHLAARVGNIELLRAMDQRGVNFNLPTDSGATCLHVACEFGHERVVEYLYGLSQQTAPKVALNPLNDTKHTPLMLALKHRHLHLQTILEKMVTHATLNLQNAEGQTASMIALMYGMPTISDSLIKRGESVSIKDNYENTYLDYLIRNGELSRIEEGYRIVYPGPGSVGYCNLLTPQHLIKSARFGQFVILQALMRHFGEAFWNIPQLLNYAAQVDEVGFVRRYAKEARHSPATMAEYGSERCLDFLLQRVCQNFLQVKYLPLLQNSINSAHPALVRKIIYQMPADEFKRAIFNEDGCTPLHLAVQVGSLEIVTHLFEAGALMQHDKKGRTPLDFAIDLNDVAMSKLLLDKTKHAEWPSIRLQDKKELSDEMKKWMKENGVVIHETTLILAPVFDALHKAIAIGNFETFKTLVNTQTMNARNARGETPLMVAARTGNIRCMEYLFELGANINAVDRLSRTALHHALIGKSLQAACLLHPISKNPVAQDREGMTPLMMACVKGLPFIIHPHDLKLYNKRELNALHLAIIHGHVALIKPLIEAGFSQENVDQKAMGCTPLQLSARFGQKDVFDALMPLGGNPDARDKEGRTILTHAVLSGDRPMMLKAFAIIDNPEEKVVAAAMANNSLLIDECILKNEPLDCIEPTSGLTALHVAVLNDSADVVKKLLPFVPVDSVDRDGNTSLHYAAKLGLVRITKLLLAAGAKRDCQNAHQKTPIDLAKAENRDAVLILLQRDQLRPATLLAQQGMFNSVSDPNVHRGGPVYARV